MAETTLPKLRVSREEADQKIQARIEEGQQLRNRKISNGGFQNARMECQEWSKYNKRLLPQLFDNTSIAEGEYVNFYYSDNTIPTFKLERYLRDMDMSINSLEAILQQLKEGNIKCQ